MNDREKLLDLEGVFDETLNEHKNNKGDDEDEG